MPEEQGHKYGELESRRHDARRAKFYSYLETIDSSSIAPSEIMQNFTTYIGHMTLNRLLVLNELYNSSSLIAGHIADVGVYKGFSSFLFAKLIKIHESEALTLCHGFDWFRGQVVGEKDSKLTFDAGYNSDFSYISELISKQDLDDVLKIHNLDLRRELDTFFKKYPHLRFRLVNMDCGKYDVVKHSLPHFWNRLNKGGIIIFDQYSHEHAPGETLAVHEVVPDIKLRTIKNAWTPTAYAIKE